jgi:hypothetical protein
MAKKRYTKKKSSNKDFPYKPIKDKLVWFDAQSETGWCTQDQMDKLKPAVSKV